MDLRGKNVLVTGGGSGIGKSVALAFARERARVAIAGRRKEALEQVAAEWSRAGGGDPPMLLRAADVADRGSARELIAWAERELGRIDVLVLAAGANIKRRMLADIDPAEWDRLLAINATGAFNCLHPALPAMRARREGLVILISSTSGKRAALLGGVAYNASKFAMTALGTSAALEEGKHGIRVTTIFPGEVNTPILDERPQPVSDEHRRAILQPEDIAAAALFVACLPPRAHVAELIIKPVQQNYA